MVDVAPVGVSACFRPAGSRGRAPAHTGFGRSLAKVSLPHSNRSAAPSLEHEHPRRRRFRPRGARVQARRRTQSHDGAHYGRRYTPIRVSAIEPM